MDTNKLNSKKEEKYKPQEIEAKWQKEWESANIYLARDNDPKSKFYSLIEFPYPSGAGLHVGHVRSYSAMDALSRKKRMEGFNVLYPIGWDAFGLPAENYAIKNKIHPSVAVQQNVTNFKRQIKSLGMSFDWSREVNTTDSKYYKWTQWIFLKFLEKGLAFRADVTVNWCPFCKTNLADEEVLPDGTHERCGTLTEKKLQKQWLLKITEYAERLIEDLKLVNYSPQIAQQQINWIGRKKGINIDYHVILSETKDLDSSPAKPDQNDKTIITCFTTRPDTNFGATFIVIGPEHPFVSVILNSFQDLKQKEMLKQVQHDKSKVQDDKKQEIKKYVEAAKKKSEIDRIAEGRKKTGVFSGFYAVNNLNGKRLPIWISDFVLGHVGTGAVVGVPGHDIRDFEFAKEFNLPIIRVVVGEDGDTSDITEPSRVQEESGTMINSEFLNGLDIHEATEKIMDYLEEKGWGKRIVSYHLRDWVFSRQHYWGEPIPVVYCDKDGIVPVPEKDLPVELPYLEKYEPSGTGESPLANVKDWVNVACPECGGSARRETDTMPNWAGSNWYYLAYLFADKLGVQSSKIITGDRHSGESRYNRDDSRIDSGQARMTVFEENKDVIKYWMPVDLYQGGFEHTTLHLLYSRFVYKFLYDCGIVPTAEPYARRRSHGIVLGPDGRKMSKSFGNVINPDEIVGKFGADTLRVYEMFMGPFDQMIAWSEEGVEGCYRFLKRVWVLSTTKVQGLSNYSSSDSPVGEESRSNENSSRQARTISSEEKTSKELLVSLNKTIKKVGEDLDNLKFNTAVASMMEFINEWQKDEKGLAVEDLKKFLLILSPFAPHITEELWNRIQFSVISSQLSDSSQSVIGQSVSDKQKTGKLNSENRQLKTENWSIHQQSWPSFDKKYLVENEAVIVVQVNGKVRDSIRVESGELRVENFVKEQAMKSANVRKYLEGKEIKKVIYVEGKIINFVVI